MTLVKLYLDLSDSERAGSSSREIKSLRKLSSSHETTEGRRNVKCVNLEATSFLQTYPTPKKIVIIKLITGEVSVSKQSD